MDRAGAAAAEAVVADLDSSTISGELGWNDEEDLERLL